VLKKVPAIIGPELLHSLASMGHGDVVVVVDRNYPAYAAGRPVHRLDGVGVEAAIEAITQLFPIDDFTDEPAYRMHPDPARGDLSDVHRRVAEILDRAEGRAVGFPAVERFECYRRATAAFAIVATSESEPYCCFGLTKGVVR